MYVEDNAEAKRGKVLQTRSLEGPPRSGSPHQERKLADGVRGYVT